MNARRQKTRKIILTWLLLAVFIPQLTIKALHTCQYEKPAVYSLSASEGAQLNQGNAGCLICHYVFSPFNSVDFFTPGVAIVTFLGVILLPCQARPCAFRIDTVSLRAPPVAAC